MCKTWFKFYLKIPGNVQNIKWYKNRKSCHKTLLEWLTIENNMLSVYINDSACNWRFNDTNMGMRKVKLLSVKNRKDGK